MQVVLGSNGANHASASSGSRCIRTSAPTDWNYVVGRMGRKIQDGTEVNLRQQKESRECRGQDPSDGTVFSVDFPWGTMKGVSDEYNWLLIEDESGCRVVPAPFVHLKSSNPEVPYDINQVEKEMEKRREKRNQEDRRAKKSRRLEDHLVGKLKPFELPDIASDDNNSDCEAAGAVKNIRREEEGWDARKEEVNEFADDDESVVEWSDAEEEAPVKPAKSPEEEESDEDSNGKEFKTADDEKDLLDAAGRELDRMLDDLDLPTAKSTDRDDQLKLVVSAAEKRAIKYAEKFIAPATPETVSTEAPSEISKPESSSSDGSIPNRSPAMRQFPVVRTTQNKLPSLFSKDPKTAIKPPSINAMKLCWSAKTPSQTSKAKAVPSVPLSSIGRCPSASSRTRDDLKTSSGVKSLEKPAVTGCVTNDERRNSLQKITSTPLTETPPPRINSTPVTETPPRIMSARQKSVVNDESVKPAVVVNERRRQSTAVSPPEEIPLPRRTPTEKEELLPREPSVRSTCRTSQVSVKSAKSTSSKTHRSSPKSETVPVNPSPPSETIDLTRVKSSSSRSEKSAPREGHRSSPVTLKSSPVRRKDTVSVEPTKRRCDDDYDETDRATILSRINSALDRPGGATLESVLATFDITHKHSALYEIVVSELKIVAKLKHSGYLVRRKKPART